VVAELTPTGARAAEFCTQTDAAYRFDWGPNGLRTLAPHADVVVVVDVLRFTTAVCAALEAGATVYPYKWADDGADAYARERDAVLAGRREDAQWSLSPTDLLHLEPGTRLVLPSPNGSALAFAAGEAGARHVLAACLRNATATAHAARRLAGADGSIAVIAAGERWHGATGPIRPAVEDLWGAGAVLAALDPSASRSAPRCSPEAASARAAFIAARPRLFDELSACASGIELIARGWHDDVHTAAAHDVTDVVCRLTADAFTPPV
jgi:2-phosphosulfolactate phosphatase